MQRVDVRLVWRSILFDREGHGSRVRHEGRASIRGRAKKGDVLPSEYAGESAARYRTTVAEARSLPRRVGVASRRRHSAIWTGEISDNLRWPSLPSTS